MIEYNAVVGPRLQWTMPYNPTHQWNETAWHAAGLAALERLGRRLGYVLVGCDSLGVNAFFVRRSDAHRFSTASVRDLWVPPRYSLPYGHPVRRFTDCDVPPLPEGSGGGITLRASYPRPTTVRPGQIFHFDVMLTNETDDTFACSGPHPVQLAYWWIDEHGCRLIDEPVRCHQLWRSSPRMSCNLLCRVQAPRETGTYSLGLGLVQEGVRWLSECDITSGEWTVASSSP